MRAITVAPVIAIALLPIVWAQTPQNVVILVGKPYSQYQEVTRGFVEEWKQIAGMGPQIVEFYQEGLDRDLLLRRNPELVVGLGEEPTVWAIYRSEGFPLGFTMVLDPERLKEYRESSPHSTRTLIGISIEVPVQEKLKILVQLMPTLKRIGVLSFDPSLREEVAVVRQACARHKLQLVHAELSSLSELPHQLDQLLRQVDLLWSVPDTQVFQPQLARHIIGQCATHNVPLMGLSAVFVRAGATLSFDRDYDEVGRLLARHCLSPPTDGSHDLTLASPQRIVVSTNQRSFQALGLRSDIESHHVRVVTY